MKLATAAMSLLLLLGIAGAASAENGCPDGMRPNPTPTGTPGANQCVPGPSGGGWPPVDNTPPEPKSYNGYGALAFAQTSVAVGASDKKDLFGSRRQAERSALKSCKANGGTDCKIVLSFVNECAVAVLGADASGSKIAIYAGTGKEVVDAKNQAEAQCKAQGSPMCKPVYSNCVERWKDW